MLVLLLLQSTLIISTSLFSNNRLSRSENLVPVLTQRSTNRQQNIVEKRSNFSSFPQYFQYISTLGVKLHIHSVKGGCSINCFPQLRKSDMSKYGYRSFTKSLGIRDNESRLYYYYSVNTWYWHVPVSHLTRHFRNCAVCIYWHVVRQWSFLYFPLILKAPRKPASESVVCLCRLCIFFQTFQTYFLHIGKQCGPRSDCS